MHLIIRCRALSRSYICAPFQSLFFLSLSLSISISTSFSLNAISIFMAWGFTCDIIYPSNHDELDAWFIAFAINCSNITSFFLYNKISCNKYKTIRSENYVIFTIANSLVKCDRWSYKLFLYIINIICMLLPFCSNAAHFRLSEFGVYVRWCMCVFRTKWTVMCICVWLSQL